MFSTIQQDDSGPSLSVPSTSYAPESAPISKPTKCLGILKEVTEILEAQEMTAAEDVAISVVLKTMLGQVKNVLKAGNLSKQDGAPFPFSGKS